MGTMTATTMGRLVAVAATAALGFSLTACGASEDESSVEELITRHYATPSCDDLTDAGREAFGHPVEDAACAVDLASQKPKDVSVSDIEIDGDKGTAVADDYTFKLRKVDDTWLIDG